MRGESQLFPFAVEKRDQPRALLAARTSEKDDVVLEINGHLDNQLQVANEL
jgi:hypothetical protein